MAAKPALLIVDDDPGIHVAIREVLEGEYGIQSAYDPLEALDILDREPVHCILLDLRFPGKNGATPAEDGFWLLRELRERDVRAPVIMLTVVNTVTAAFKAGTAGAVAFLAKPWTLDDLRRAVADAIELAQEKNLEHVPDPAGASRGPFQEILWRSPTMGSVLDHACLVSRDGTGVLIVGETGTGKELLARAIHDNGPRRGKPFIAINCGAIPEGLKESEWFGYEKGAFTGAVSRKIGLLEQAHGGTLFLDEVGEMGTEAQVTLLRWLDSGIFRRLRGTTDIRVDVRIIAATNRDLEADVGEGRFRRDLYYRLAVLQIRLPMLRERREDIPMLANYYLDAFARHHRKSIGGFSEDAMRLLCDHGWPGNVRELKNAVEALVVLEKRRVIGAEAVHRQIARRVGHVEVAASGKVIADSIGESTEHEKRRIVDALNRCGWHQTLTARALRMHRTTLYRKMREHGICRRAGGRGGGGHKNHQPIKCCSRATF